MVSILPNQRSPFDVIGADVGQALQGVLPGAVQQGYQRGQGLSAIDQLQQALSAAGGDINKILPALAKAYTLNPNLERSGLGQQYLQQARAGKALNNQFGGQQQPSQAPPLPNFMQGAGQSAQPQLGSETFSPSTAVPSGIIPDIKSQGDLEGQARQWALDVGDANAYDQKLNSLINQNNAAKEQMEGLKNLAKNQNISDKELPEFMQIGKRYNYLRDPNEWVRKTNKDFSTYKNAKDQLNGAFIPGFWTGLISSAKDRQESLDKLNDPVKTILEMNPQVEPEIRNFLQGEYLSPTEVEGRIHPLSEKIKSNLDKLPNGIFYPKEPTDQVSIKGGHPKIGGTPFISYEEAQKKDPRAMKVMNKRLVDFIKNNWTEDMSLDVLRDQIVNEKHYDWRQFANALQEARTGENSIKLSPSQQGELSEITTQAPRQSLSNIFSDWGRWIEYLRGSK